MVSLYALFINYMYLFGAGYLRFLASSVASRVGFSFLIKTKRKVRLALGGLSLSFLSWDFSCFHYRYTCAHTTGNDILAAEFSTEFAFFFTSSCLNGTYYSSLVIALL